MKKLLLSFLFITAAAFIAPAQNAKPTKEATQKFLNLMLGSVIGENSIDEEGTLIKKQEFNESFESFEYLEGDVNSRWGLRIEVIRWQNLIKTELVEKQYYSKSKLLKITFSSNLKIYLENGPYNKEKFEPTFELRIPQEKTESCIKAILRLAEIAKEENKDPFK